MSILVFDLPKNKSSDKVRINRELHRINAEMIQFSVWSSDNAKDLIRIAVEIKNLGGKARILEESFVF